ncbi:MAG: hypothetical protein ACI9MC_002256 [Kiritimatiellia bacterium]|jgi:hypothetical protein
MLRSLLLVGLMGSCVPQAIETPAEEPAHDRPVSPGGLLPMPDATRAQICADDCLLLTRYDFNTVKHRYAELCCAEGDTDARCTHPWPWDGKPKCDQVEYLRNCISARYGKVFDEPEWQARFDRESWYQQGGAFQPAAMSINAKRNDMLLMQILLNKEDCTKSDSEPADSPDQSKPDAAPAK